MPILQFVFSNTDRPHELGIDDSPELFHLGQLVVAHIERFKRGEVLESGQVCQSVVRQIELLDVMCKWHSGNSGESLVVVLDLGLNYLLGQVHPRPFAWFGKVAG